MTQSSAPTPITASAPALITYDGPREVLINQATILQGKFDRQKVSKVTLVAEDKYALPVNVNTQAGTWQVTLSKGFNTAGSRWLRLKGTDSAGKVLDSKVIYITVGTDPLTIGQVIVLKVVLDTYFKTAPSDSARLNNQQKVFVKAGQTFKVSKYGLSEGHLKVTLSPPIAPIGEFGYFYEKAVQLSKGSKILKFDAPDSPTIPLAAQLLVTTTTLLKTKPQDSTILDANQKVELTQGKTFEITGYAAIQGHFRITFAQDVPGIGKTGFIYWQHVQVSKNGKVVNFDPDALTVTALRTTIFKKRLVDSSQLQDAEKFNFPEGMIYGVGSYALANDHIKVALTNELPGFGNTGFIYTDFVQMKRGGQAFNPFPPQIELNVPYFSQRDNPRLYWSTCNVTSIAMVLYYYGLRPKGGGQLEDELLQWTINKYGQGAQTDNSALSQLIQAYGFKTSFSTTRKWAELKNELSNGRPVVIGGMFTHGGHIVTGVGFTPQGYIINDPWGNALTGYSNTEGKKLLYPNSYMDQVAGPDGGVWAHFISR